jgi:hypothetical protein
MRSCRIAAGIARACFTRAQQKRSWNIWRRHLERRRWKREELRCASELYRSALLAASVTHCLAVGLQLHERRLDCSIYERATEFARNLRHVRPFALYWLERTRRRLQHQTSSDVFDGTPPSGAWLRLIPVLTSTSKSSQPLPLVAAHARAQCSFAHVETNLPSAPPMPDGTGRAAEIEAVAAYRRVASLQDQSCHLKKHWERRIGAATAHTSATRSSSHAHPHIAASERSVLTVNDSAKWTGLSLRHPRQISNASACRVDAAQGCTLATQGSYMCSTGSPSHPVKACSPMGPAASWRCQHGLNSESFCGICPHTQSPSNAAGTYGAARQLPKPAEVGGQAALHRGPLQERNCSRLRHVMHTSVQDNCDRELTEACTQAYHGNFLQKRRLQVCSWVCCAAVQRDHEHESKLQP